MKHLLPLTVGALCAASLGAQTIQQPFTGVYGYTDLGSVPGVPANYGGITFKNGDNNKLLIGGSSCAAAGAIYEIAVTRDGTGRLTGFAGTATVLSTAPYIDGGLCYAPNGVLMYTGYPVHQFGQIKPGSSAPDRVDAMGPLGIPNSVGACNFVPPGFPGAGQLKLVSYNANMCTGVTISPDANGTYDLALANGPVPISGGPEGILYVPPGSSLIPDYQYVLIAEWGFGNVVLFQIDAAGNPVLASRLPFLTGLSGAEGACTDPVTGALVFSTFGGGNHVVMVEGFGVCGSHENYGAGIAGQNGAPTITGGGCAGRGQITSVNAANGPAGALGILAVGFAPSTVPLLNGTLLVQIVTSYFHTLDGAGQWSLSLYLPTDPIWNGLNLYTQSFYLDPAAAQGVSATNGLHTLVR